jgi:cation diffusion facilitator family transporter
MINREVVLELGGMNVDLSEKMSLGEKGVWISILSYIMLSIIKVTIGYYYHSEALYADGLNNTTDIIASIAVIIGLRISRRPADHNHRYGHYRAETVAALLASFIMMTVGLFVLYRAVNSYFIGEIVKPDLLTAIVAIASAGVMGFVYVYNIRLAAKINSSALKAVALDNRSDALVSIGAFVGIVGAQLGWSWLDPIAALGVGMIICRTSVDIFRDASHALTDGFDANVLKVYRKTIEAVSGVKKVQDLRARIHGNNVLLDVTIVVDAELNVVESHRISDKIEDRMNVEHQVEHVHIHVEPTKN